MSHDESLIGRRPDARLLSERASRTTGRGASCDHPIVVVPQLMNQDVEEHERARLRLGPSHVGASVVAVDNLDV